MKATFDKFLNFMRRAGVRAAKGSRRRGAVASQTTGRNIRIVKYVKGFNILAPVQSITAAVSNGNYDISDKKLRVTDDDLVGWNRMEYESLTLILLVDVSQSTWPFLEVFRSILESLTNRFRKHNDRVGLISLQGLQARIYMHPTHNFRVVARALSKLEFHGETPLADGLQKSLNMAISEKNKNAGSKSIVILLSDCYPEPVRAKGRDVLDDPAYRDSIQVASTFRKAKVTLLTINPDFNSEEGRLSGEILSKRLAEVSGGILIKLIRPKDRKGVPPDKREMRTILKGVEACITGETHTIK